MPFHILLEDGSSLLQEDGASFLLLEDAVATVVFMVTDGPCVNWIEV